MKHTPFDAEGWLDTTAPALGLPITAEQRPGVVLNLEIAAQMAARLLAVPLDDTIDLAPVFQPGAHGTDA